MTRPVRYGQCPFANDPPFLVARSVLRGSAHGSIASSFAISFASRVVQEVTQRPRQLMDEPSPCSSVLSIQESWMWDGCVEIVRGFDTKDDGWGWLVVAWWLVVFASGLESGCIVVELALGFPKGRRITRRFRPHRNRILK